MRETTISRNWLAKMTLFIAAFIGLGIWGLVDAVWVYPARGERYAEFMQFQYLAAQNDAGQLLRSSIEDPRAEYERLQQEADELRDELAASAPESVARRRVEAELDKLAWLRSLAVISQLEPERTRIEAPTERLETLEAEWATREQPKGLSALDIPTQWLFVVIGFGGGLWMLLVVLRVLKTKFRYDEAEHRLVLPGGESFTPSEIQEVDKRKWDKFFVTIKLEDGSSHKLDLLRYQPLEQWVLEMEKLSPNYEPPEEDEAEAARESTNAAQPAIGGNPVTGETDAAAESPASDTGNSPEDERGR
jgi:hypothetical protein